MRIEFNGLDLADESLFNVTGIEGLDSLPDLTIGMAPKPRRHGSWLGGKLAQKRVITITLQILGDPEDGYRTTKPKNALVNALQIMDSELPLVFELDYGDQPTMVYASVTALDLPISRGYSAMREATIEFTCTDPMKYAAESKQGQADPPSPPTAVPYGLTYGFQYSEDAGITGSFTAHNGGNTAAPVVYTIEGPVSRPSISLLDAEGSWVTTFAVNLGEKDVLRVDTAANRVTLNGSDAFGSAFGSLITSLVIRPGDTIVSFGGDVPSGKFPKLNASWRDTSR